MKEMFMKIFKGIFVAIVWIGCVPQAYANPYDTHEEYAIHQKVSNLFFTKSPKNPATIAALEKFREEYAISPEVSKIKLDEFSPRSRILLLRSISQTIFTRYKSEKKFKKLYSPYSYFKKDEQNSQSACSKEDIAYSFGNAEFVVRYKPNETDPGNLEIFTVRHKSGEKNPNHLAIEMNNLNCENFCKGLINADNVNRSKEIAGFFINGYKQCLPCKQDHLNKVFIFFDFQTARWSTRNISSHEEKEMPIASAIINYLKLSRKYVEYQLHGLFEKPIVKIEEPEFVSKKIDNNNSQELFIEEVDGEEVYAEEIRVYNGYNPFEGASWMGEAATKNILTERYKKKKEKFERKEGGNREVILKKKAEEEAECCWREERIQKWWRAECSKREKAMNLEKEEEKKNLGKWLADEKKNKSQWSEDNEERLKEEYVLFLENKAVRKKMKVEAKDRWITEQAQIWWKAECLKAENKINLEDEDYKNNKTEEWVKKNQKELEDKYYEHTTTSQYYRHFGGQNEDAEYWE